MLWKCLPMRETWTNPSTQKLKEKFYIIYNMFYNIYYIFHQTIKEFKEDTEYQVNKIKENLKIKNTWVITKKTVSWWKWWRHSRVWKWNPVKKHQHAKVDSSWSGDRLEGPNNPSRKLKRKSFKQNESSRR